MGCGGNTYTITGKLDPGITDSVFLMQGNPENPTIASAAVAADGTFKIKGTIDQPDLAILTNRHRQGIGFIFLEPGKIDVKTADLGQFQVGGTRSNEIFQPINDSLGMLQGQFLVAMQENDMEKFDSLNQVANGIMRRALDNNSDNLVGVYFFGNLYNEMEPQEAREILNKFPEQMQKTQILTAIAKSIAAQENTEIGKPYLEIALPDSPGRNRFGDTPHRPRQMGADRLLGNLVQSLPRRIALSEGGVQGVRPQRIQHLRRIARQRCREFGKNSL